jgi:transglutaminase-like putative cysteine protease
MIEQAQLDPGPHIESDAAPIVAFAETTCEGAADEVERAVRLYGAIRDQITYDPYDRVTDPQTCSALRALERKRGYCIPKAALLVACARSLGIPGRLGFADVRNHLASRRMIEANNGDVFRWHCHAQLHLGGKWVKATPAFDITLCRRVGIEPLEFDGCGDSLFHSFDRNRKHMEYVLDRGWFNEIPHEAMLATWSAECPAIFNESYYMSTRSFAEEVQVDKQSR